MEMVKLLKGLGATKFRRNDDSKQFEEENTESKKIQKIF